MSTLVLDVWLVGFFVVVGLSTITWLIQSAREEATVNDIAWGIGFILLTGLYCYLAPGFWFRKLVIFMSIFFWGTRIANFILIRMILDKEEDKRYQKIRTTWGGNINLKFFTIFQTQAIIQIFMSLPILMICFNTSSQVSVFEVIGLGTLIIAYFGEALADDQLEKFKRNSENKGKVCQAGLWNYSRHPNYFFEFLFWFGVYIFSLGSPGGWMTVISPAIILWLVLKVTGIPMTEKQSLQSRGDLYREYQKTTSPFIPLPKRKVTV